MDRDSLQMDASSREAEAHLRLIAEGYDGLYEALTNLKGLPLARRYVLRSLFAVGGQSILWLTEDLAQPMCPVLVRMALLPYHRPAYIKEADIQRARQRIEREARLLRRFGGTPFPRLYALIHAPNPLQPPERGPDITDSWAYIPPEYYHDYDTGSWRWPTPGFVTYTLGKTLWQLLTDRQPMPGEHPDLDRLDLLSYPPGLTQFVRGLVDGRYQDFASLQEAARQLTPALSGRQAQ